MKTHLVTASGQAKLNGVKVAQDSRHRRLRQLTVAQQHGRAVVLEYITNQVDEIGIEIEIKIDSVTLRYWFCVRDQSQFVSPHL